MRAGPKPPTPESGHKHSANNWDFLIWGVLLRLGYSQGVYQNEDPLDYGNSFAVPSHHSQPENEYGYLDKLFDVEVSKKDGVTGKDFFPLLMPKVHPPQEEAYLCTPIEIKDEEYYITGI